MSTPVETVRERLELAGCNPRGGEERYVARCPAHSDRAPSLSVREGDDGRALVHCFAGCTAQEIVAALGLDLRDLFEPRAMLPPPRPRRRVPEPGINALLWRLRELGRDYRCTRNPDLWVTSCPRCEGFPLLIHREPGGLRLACPSGCGAAQVTEALR